MSKLKKEGTKLAFFKFLSWIIGQNENSSHLLQITKEKNVGNRGGGPVASEDGNGGFKREKDLLLSRIPTNPTFRIHRSEKESCSTRRGLRVDSGFESF